MRVEYEKEIAKHNFQVLKKQEDESEPMSGSIVQLESDPVPLLGGDVW